MVSHPSSLTRGASSPASLATVLATALFAAACASARSVPTRPSPAVANAPVRLVAAVPSWVATGPTTPAADSPCRVLVDAPEARRLAGLGERVRASSRLECPGLRVTSISALGPTRVGIAMVSYSPTTPPCVLGLADGAFERSTDLPQGSTLARLARDGTRTLDALGSVSGSNLAAHFTWPPSLDPAQPSVESLPDVGHLMFDAARAPDGRMDVLIGRNDRTSVSLHLAHRAANGSWSTSAVAEIPWPYAGLSLDASGESVVAFCTLSAQPSLTELRFRRAETPVQTALHGVNCSDQPLEVVATRAGPVIAFRAEDLHVAAPGNSGHFDDLRLPGTRFPDTLTCTTTPSPALTAAGDARCTTRAEGASGHGLIQTARGVFAVYVDRRIDIDQRVERRCRPVDRVGSGPAPSGCEDTVHPVEDRSEATLVVVRVDTSGPHAALHEALRIPLGRIPGSALQLLLAPADDIVHALVMSNARSEFSMRYFAINLAIP